LNRSSHILLFQQITDLKKENFNLKLRIYFLEERMQQKFDGPTEDIYKINIELKVELESLKRELQKREHLLIKASKAVESLTESGGSEIQCVKEEARKKLQQVEDLLTGRIRLLEEDVKAAQAEVEKAFEIAEKEKVLRMNLEEKLSFAKNPHQRDLDVVPALEEKDRLIEELTLSLKNKEALIQHLQEEKSQMESPDGSLSSEKVRELTAALKQEKDCELEAVKMEFRNERNCFEKRMQSLQEDLQEKECEIALEKKNGLKRDKTIQGLTIALKAKEKETEELSSEIEDLISSLAKQREAAHRAQLLKFKGAEDYQIALMEKETVLAELQSDNLTKDTENRKLVRRIKWLDQELNDLRQEREKMEKELDEAQLQKSRGDKTINDLRNQVEKLHGEMIEKEKAVEHHYNILLSESNQKLHSQELAIKHLTDSVSQKDILLQVLLFAFLLHSLPISTVSFCSQENKESEYEELIHALRKEKHIYSSLVKALKDSDSINSLQAELSNIFALRKQLEDDVLAYRNLRKVLEEQIREIGRREETFSFCGDQTSYLSICLGEHDRFQTEHLSLEELKKRVIELVLLVKDLHADNQNLKKSLLELSRLTPQETETSSDKKSRLPIPLKPSRSLGSVNLTSATQETAPYLPNQIGEPHGDLKEYKTRNKQLRPELSATEAMIEKLQEHPKYQSYCRPEDFPDEASSVSYTSSKSFFSPKGSLNGTAIPEDVENLDDLDYLQERIKGLKSELEKYQKVVFQLQVAKQSQCREAIDTVLGGTEEAPEGQDTPRDRTEDKEMKMSPRFHQLPYEKWAEIPNPPASEVSGERIVENLKQQLEDRETELEKEQAAKMTLLGELCSLQTKLREMSPSRYDSLVQSQARELSSQRQQIKDSLSICVSCRQHMTALIKALEELLQASDVDYRVADGIREQLNRSVQLFEKLEKMFLNGKWQYLHCFPYKMNENFIQDFLRNQSPMPSDCEVSEKSSVGSPERKPGGVELEKISVLASNFSQDLLMEHLQEIRTLRKRLEESIKTNDRLRKQLERQGTELETGSANIFIHGSEQHNSLTSEIHFLRKQNQALNVMLAKGSRDKQKENEKLRESLSKKDVIIEHLHRDYECVKKENERLQKQVSEKEKDNRLLTHEIYSNRNELNRLQTEMNVKQQQLSANDKLLQSLRVELKVYEKLDEASRRPIAAAEECRKDQNNLLDLAELLTEIQSLRVQLERSIETNNALRRKLEEQLSKGERELEGSVQTLNINHLSKQEWHKTPTSCFPASETPLASVEDLDSSSCCSSGSASSSLCTPPRLVPGHRMWANKNGRHILGLIEDYNALRKQISEGQKQLSEMETHLLGITGLKNQETGFKVPDQASLNSFSASVNTAQQILEEAARLLKLLWRVSLPINGHCTLPSNQGEEMKAEVIRLRKKMSEQEKKLHCTVKNLQLRKHQEKVIFDQSENMSPLVTCFNGNLGLFPVFWSSETKVI
uniref:CDK5 regulatory subunit-associated protein 2 n=1 Tax=Ornithorhynchus anatinus TaxID=9258 RepID=A0A6I8PAL9_ORNAN